LEEKQKQKSRAAATRPRDATITCSFGRLHKTTSCSHR